MSQLSDPRTMRIMQLLQWITPVGGGVQSYFRGLLSAFSGSGYHFVAGAYRPGAPPAQALADVHLGTKNASTFLNVVRLWRWIGANIGSTDVVQIHGIYGWHFIAGAAICLWRKVPYIVNPHNSLADVYLRHSRIKKDIFFATIGGFLLKRAALVVATSPSEAAFIRERFPRFNTTLILPGLEIPTPPDPDLLRLKDGEPLRLLYLGRFDPWKRIPNLIEALAMLLRQGIRAQLHIAGTGPEAETNKLKEEVRRHGIGHAVTFCGFVSGDAKLELIRSAHVLVLPAITDSYSMATAEAFSCGRAVVVTTGAGAANAIREHDCGSVVPIDDAAALADAISTYHNPQVLQEKSLRAYRYALAELGLSAMKENMSKAYSLALGPGARA